jgi:FkbM family methyltransferase
MKTLFTIGSLNEMKSRARSLLQRHGILVTRYPLQDCLQYICPTTILDVGANVGQYGLELRSLGFRGRIHSFEPFLPAFNSLQEVAAQSRPLNAWHCHHFGLGEKEGEAAMNVSSESVFNSLREPLPQSAALHSGIVANKTVSVKIRTLDSVWQELNLSEERVFLKIDTQGYELPILQGGGSALERISAIQLEVSLTPLYKDQPCIEEVVPFLRKRGFLIYGLWPTGIRVRKQNRLIEADFIFIKA